MCNGTQSLGLARKPLIKESQELATRAHMTLLSGPDAPEPDVRLKMEDGTLPARRFLLAESSDYFKAMFQACFADISCCFGDNLMLGLCHINDLNRTQLYLYSKNGQMCCRNEKIDTAHISIMCSHVRAAPTGSYLLHVIRSCWPADGLDRERGACCGDPGGCCSRHADCPPIRQWGACGHS